MHNLPLLDTEDLLIYLDHNATTPCAPEVVKAMSFFWSEQFGNPSSLHLAGRQASRRVLKARTQVADLANCQSEEILFTSGATESNNIVFLGLLLSDKLSRPKLVTTRIEHSSVLEPARLLSQRGICVDYLPVSRDGLIDLDAARGMISEETSLVSVHSANNEIGSLQPLEEVSKIAHHVGAYFHTDAAQALGKIPVDLDAWGCDFASFSSHKLYGPKGIGALFVKGGSHGWPWAVPIRGGGQEGGLRPGTVNVPSVVGFGEACRLAIDRLSFDMVSIQKLRNEFENKLLESIPNTVIHARQAQRLPGTISVAFKDVPADLLIDNLATMCIGRGSACSSGALDNSHVLKAIGCESSIANATVRLSLGRGSLNLEVDQIVGKIADSVFKIRDKLRVKQHDTG